MVDENRWKQTLSQWKESLNEQVWFQELKAKWDDVDPQSRLYVKFASIGILFVATLGVVFASLWSVHKLKREYAEKSELLQILESANSELAVLKASLPSGQTESSDAPVIWNTFLESIATQAGVDRSALTISPEKISTEGKTGNTKEALIDVELKKINIKQLVRYAYHLENSSKPVKIRSLTIGTEEPGSGSLNATVSVSAFSF
jgi:uncharacterized membrane protein